MFVVIGVTMVVAAYWLPMSFWTTTAGRIHFCSLPRPGLKLTSQTSPRFGRLGSVERLNAASESAFRGLPVFASHRPIPVRQLAL